MPVPLSIQPMPKWSPSKSLCRSAMSGYFACPATLVNWMSASSIRVPSGA
jgi:hypothetical protein